MTYDFRTFTDRSRQGSEKWDIMYECNPKVGKDIPPFSVADMDLKHPPQFVEGMKKYMNDIVLGYSTPTRGYYDAVLSWMKRRHHWDIKEEWIVITPGIIPAIYNLIQTFTSKNDGVIVLTPVYYPFYNAIKTNDRVIVGSKLDNSSGKYEIDFDDLESKAKDPNNKLMIFCSPHNPVGRVWTKEEIQKVGRICLDNDVIIVSDEIHFDLIMPGSKHTVFADISDEFRENVITCTAPSKSFNLAGMMTSNIIIPNKDYRTRFSKQLDTNGISVWNPLGFEACRLSYDLCEDWLNGLIDLINTNYLALKDYLDRKLPGVNLYPLEGTYLAWMDFNSLGMGHKELEQFMTMKAQVFFDEGYIFGSNGRGFERMNIACPTDAVLAAMDRIRTSI